MPKLKPYDLSKVTEAELAYLAGLVDGEGCFYIGHVKTRSKPTGLPYYNYHSLLKISNNCKEVLEWVYNTFGGRTTLFNKKTKDHTRNFITYDWYATGYLVRDLTILLLPYLIIKKAQAEVMIKMRNTFPESGSRGPCQPNADILELRAKLCTQMHRLNSRFKNHPDKRHLYKDLAPCLPSATQLGVPSQSEKI